MKDTKKINKENRRSEKSVRVWSREISCSDKVEKVKKKNCSNKI